MVSKLSILFMGISILIIFALPTGLAIYFIKKEKASLKSVLAGAFIFVVSQVLTRIPLLQALGSQDWYRAMAAHAVLTGLFLGVTAGLFEEIGRFLGYRHLLKNRLNWADGVAYGIGHGGIEAILLVGVSYITNLVFSLAINAGTFESQVAAFMPAETAAQLKAQLTGTAPFLFLVGGLERVFAMTVHMALSLVVLYGVKKKAFKYVLVSVLLHTLLNAPLPMLQAAGVGLVGIEGYVGLCAAAALWFLLKSKGIFTKQFGADAGKEATE